MKNETLKKLYNEIEKQKTRSKWENGVKLYALDLIEDLYYIEEGETITSEGIKKMLLNGAEDWRSYSWGGCSLIYDWDICERLATPSEQKKTRNGERRPNANEEWLDTQARALYQASNLIYRTLKRLERGANNEEE